MEKPFVYGMSVEGVNFTDRVKETQRLKINFENGINVTLISPRRMGKTSLVKKAISEVDNPKIKIIYLDIYDCRSEYDFYNRFASAILKATSNHISIVLDNVRKFLERISPKVSFGSIDSEFSISLGITPQQYSPEEILALPEIIAKEKDLNIVVCIDEFQQIGEFPHSLDVQKRLRGVWQHQTRVSYCLFGSKKHLMENIFQNKRMPFYMFGEMMNLGCIPTEYWIPYICGRFEKYGKKISAYYARRICEYVGNYSSYVQQLAWNVLSVTESEVDEETFIRGIEAMMEQCESFFIQQTENLTSYQLNFLRRLASGETSDFTALNPDSPYPLGSKSNVARLRKSLLDKELISKGKEGIRIADTVFLHWFRKEMM